MFKKILLASSMIVAAPVFAQAAPGQQTTPSATTQPGQAMPQSPTATAPTGTAPTGDPMTAQTSPATPAQTSPADPAVAQQDPAAAGTTAATQPTQVASIVDQEFPSYDKNGDGKLDQPEFAAWMVALKTASDPATKADSPATKKWIGTAFAQADTDKSKSLSKTELTGFLSQGQS